MRNLTRFGLAAGATAAIVAAIGGPANAEPPTTPASTSYVAVGSDTLQAVYDQFQVGYPKAPGLASWDATGTPTITPKQSCADITRPNGSGGGISALAANASTADAHYCVNVARSSRGTQTGDPVGLSWLDLGSDGVSWAAADGGNAPANLTSAQLYHVFHCDAGYRHWNESGLGGTSSDAVVPVLPQASSGTRSFFLSALNASQGQAGALAPGSCVDQTTAPEENEGTNAVFSGADAADIVFPYSAAVYAAEVFNGKGAGTQGELTIRQIDGTNPVTASGSPRTVNSSFAPKFQRLVYSVIRTAAISSTTTPDGTLYNDLLKPGTGYLCTTAAQTDLKSFGFASIGSLCGSVGAHS